MAGWQRLQYLRSAGEPAAASPEFLNVNAGKQLSAGRAVKLGFYFCSRRLQTLTDGACLWVRSPQRANCPVRCKIEQKSWGLEYSTRLIRD